ncbi:MAG TPA: nuclear transport factor 2 family protein [Sphingomicrobium sp.]|nr:nuclear transport factor 2 family protein [Sphingomicrobium sp.]
MADSTCELIESLEQTWRDALCRKDFEQLRTLIHPDFVLIGTRSTGPFRMGRDEWIDAIQRREIVGIDLEIQDAIVRDQVMIGTVFAKWRLRYMRREIEDCVVLTDVWLYDEGRWQAIRRHSTPSPTGGCSAA